MHGKHKKKQRFVLFLLWLGAGFALAFYLVLLAPLVPYFSPSLAPLALALPPAAALLLLGGLALVILRAGARHDRTEDAPAPSHRETPYLAGGGAGGDPQAANHGDKTHQRPRRERLAEH